MIFVDAAQIKPSFEIAAGSFVATPVRLTNGYPVWSKRMGHPLDYAAPPSLLHRRWLRLIYFGAAAWPVLILAGIYGEWLVAWSILGRCTVLWTMALLGIWVGLITLQRWDPLGLRVVDEFTCIDKFRYAHLVTGEHRFASVFEPYECGKSSGANAATAVTASAVVSKRAPTALNIHQLAMLAMQQPRVAVTYRNTGRRLPVSPPVPIHNRHLRTVGGRRTVMPDMIV